MVDFKIIEGYIVLRSFGEVQSRYLYIQMKCVGKLINYKGNTL